MRRLDSAIPVGHQALTHVTELCVRECASKYRVFDTRSLELNAPTRRVYRSQREFRVDDLDPYSTARSSPRCKIF